MAEAMRHPREADALYPHPEDRPLLGQPAPDRAIHPRLYVCEFWATALLLIGGICTNVVIGSPLSPVARALIHWPNLLTALEGLVFGLSATLAALSPFGRVSGAHLNPSISLAFCLGRRLALTDTVFYVFSQIAGAVLGAGLVAASGLIWPRWGAWCRAAHFAATTPSPFVPPWWAFVGEMCTTAILVAVVLYCGAKPVLRPLAAWASGPIFFLLNPFEAWLSGDSTNLARSFGPALMAGTWQDFWVYVVGPLAGASAMVFLIRAEMFGRVHLHEARLAYFGHGGRAPYFWGWISRRRVSRDVA
ncbi:MIP/aquaporin family protein [Asaia krungthepensis]|uniref:Major facilitator superfamily glycerol uptake transporter n=1 Tax=Asaia krungthepensis NRIC 0535 TaxID=1307925 RepID=A0ABQ0Q5N1_9PROT|nr:aquaporin [Asaia krungthepensis]GBQ92575.1 major facilitator superfamily glycerol uptake transporter [Asaia krungthepensis NRIC 0535]